MVHRDDVAATAYLGPTADERERWLPHDTGRGRHGVVGRMANEFIGEAKGYIRARAWGALVRHIAYECLGRRDNLGPWRYVRAGCIGALDCLSGDDGARSLALDWRECFGITDDGKRIVVATGAPGEREYPSVLQAASTKRDEVNAMDTTVFAFLWARASARKWRQQRLSEALSEARTAAADAKHAAQEADRAASGRGRAPCGRRRDPPALPQAVQGRPRRRAARRRPRPRRQRALRHQVRCTITIGNGAASASASSSSSSSRRRAPASF